jgi:glycerol uptake facilitator-like aquaporin
MKLLKNSFLGTVFLLALGSVSIVTANNENKDLEVEKRACVRTTFSFGVTALTCGDTTEEIIENAIAIDEMVCP